VAQADLKRQESSPSRQPVALADARSCATGVRVLMMTGVASQRPPHRSRSPYRSRNRRRARRHRDRRGSGAIRRRRNRCRPLPRQGRRHRPAADHRVADAQAVRVRRRGRRHSQARGDARVLRDRPQPHSPPRATGRDRVQHEPGDQPRRGDALAITQVRRAFGRTFRRGR